MRRAIGIGCGCLLLVGCGGENWSSRVEGGKKSSIAIQNYESSKHQLVTADGSGSMNQFDGENGQSGDALLGPASLSSRGPNAHTGTTTLSSGALVVAGSTTAGQTGEKIPSSASLPSDRKIVYVAEVSLVVEHFERIDKELPALIRQVGGYLADSSVAREQGEQRSGRWVARVPVDKFETFLDDLSQFGVRDSSRRNGQDVSEEYVDLEARIKNSKRLEERILKLVDERTGNIKDVAEAEQQLARVREEIERMEGRLRYLTNRTALTTVTILAREERDYKPPETPEFSTRVSRSWSTSLASLGDSSQNFLVRAVAAAPWIAVWAVILSPGIFLIRRRRRRRAAMKAAVPAPKSDVP